MRSQWEADIEGESGGEESEDAGQDEEESDKKVVHEGGSALKSP